jgi:hypothetical protein
MKSIVKECLIEILSEGLLHESNSNNSNKRKVRNVKRKLNETHKTLKGMGSNRTVNAKAGRNKRSHLEQISYGNIPSKKNNSKLKIETKDPIMKSIFEDTASTTLLEQKESKLRSSNMPSRPADDAARVVSQSEPEDLFGDASKNWEMLAFS